MSEAACDSTEASLSIRGRHAFGQHIVESIGRPLHNVDLSTFQVNLGLTCNLACRHCHVESSPQRCEQMDWPTMQAVLQAARLAGAATLDLTGGAPEMNPCFRRFVAAARAADLHVIVRTNLTILLTAGYDDLPDFFVDHAIHLVASLPCYLEDNVDRQRGRHVYAQSIQAIRRLNRLGYGIDPALPLDLVYNPLGPELPADQAALETDYRRQLRDRFDLRFTRLITLTNMPIGRFLHDLNRDNHGDAYRRLLRDNFNPATLDQLMCRHQLHISYDGTLHDCDFNYALGLTVRPPASRNIRDFSIDDLLHRPIATGEHCFGCTAGCGSSCGGALV